MGYGGNGYSGGGGGGGASSAFFAISDATLIKRTDSTSTIEDGADNAIEFTIPDGTPDGLTGGIESIEIGALWDLGSSVEPGTIESVLEWVGSFPTSCNMGVFIGRGTTPTTPQEVEDLDGVWSELFISGSGVSTYLKNGTNNFTTGTSENKSDSEAVSFAVSVDSAGMGNLISRHRYTSGSQARSTGTAKTPTTGSCFLFLFYRNNNPVSGADLTFSLKLSSTHRTVS